MKSHTGMIIMVLILLIASGLWGCKDWQYDVTHDGIHFKKLYQSENGTIVGTMTDNQNIDGFPCEKGWIHFKEDWQLLSFQLSEDFEYKDNVLPAKTWIHFPYQKDRTGFVCSFPDDIEIQGYLCGGSGGYKGTHTGFYENGRLRSFFAPEDVIVQGVPCAASILVNVNLYQDGHLKSCKLADSYSIDGKTYRKGKSISFNEDGSVKI